MNGTSIPGLIRRSITASLGASLTVTLLTVALAAGATGVPRAVHTLLTSGLKYEVAELPVTQRDLLSSTQGVVEPGVAAKPGTNTLPAESDAVWGRLDDALAKFHDSMPSQVRKRFGPARFHVTLDPHGTRPVEPGVGAPSSVVILGLDPRLAEHIQMVKGSAPAPLTRALPDRDNPTELILSVKAAELMHWPVGQERTMGFDTSPSQTVRLSGTYEAKDTGDPYWKHTASAREPTVIEEGLTRTIMAVGWLDASSWPSVAPISSEADLRTWYPLDVDTLESSEASALETELREFTRTGQDIPQQGDVLDWTGSPIRNVFNSLGFGTKTTDAIAAAEITGTSSLSMIAMTASGPLGVILAVLMMGAALVIARRRDGLSLAWARKSVV